PNIDSEFAKSETPYKTVFGGKRHLMSQLEFERQIFQAFGSLSVGVVIGYYSQSAGAFEADPTTGASTGVRSVDQTSLRLIPTAALLAYRWDVAAERFHIPLVPYGKLGLNYTFWQIKNGNGQVPSYKGGNGSGGTAGWQAAAGVALLLDFMDPEAARNLDIETGVNHSYLFFEWNHVEATGLGMKNKLHVGDSRWVLGLMCEF
ncbi:MAG TPA: MXAN_2562 family outer membrane beta-barrel protein, partial [Polyangia bacterium]